MTTNKLIFAGLLAFMILVSSQAFGQTEAERHIDKIAHGSVSAVATAGGIKVIQALHPKHDITWANRIFVSAAVLAAGYYKEVLDEQEGGIFDEQDLAADAIGILTGNFLQWEF